MSFTLPAQLPGLSDREAVADAVYRAVLAFDTADEALLRSALTEDVVVEMLGQSISGISELKAAVFDRVSKLDTTHFISNVRVSIESATAAKVSCSALAQHIGTDKGLDPASSKYTSGGLYLCDTVKVDGLWKIKTWKANFIWTNGDPSVMAGQ
ncbi:hypothetical protein V1525DRAFT_405379 [Lipomyces kononenkoae]|uniref:Uncharacterized protein n=1 Tax=Lipomyces kononenkoae TaxID=34357 RepID=A0ACC3T024_LIPKO